MIAATTPSGCLIDHHPRSSATAGDGFAVDPPASSAKTRRRRRHRRFRPRFGQRLALLGGHHGGKVFLVGHDQVEPYAPDDPALLGGLLGPQLLRRFGRPDRSARFGRAELRHMADRFVVSWIGDGDRRFAADPLAGDIALSLGSVFHQRQSRHVRPPCRFHRPLAFPANRPQSRGYVSALLMHGAAEHPDAFVDRLRQSRVRQIESISSSSVVSRFIARTRLGKSSVTSGPARCAPSSLPDCASKIVFAVPGRRRARSPCRCRRTETVPP